jgi:hypothetical protein
VNNARFGGGVGHSVRAIIVVDYLGRDLDLLELWLCGSSVFLDGWCRVIRVNLGNRCGLNKDLLDGSDLESVTARGAILVLFVTSLNDKLDGLTGQGAM